MFNLTKVSFRKSLQDLKRSVYRFVEYVSLCMVNKKQNRDTLYKNIVLLNYPCLCLVSLKWYRVLKLNEIGYCIFKA